MATLLMRLSGPLQSWGSRSRFDTRDTEQVPTKSGVLGLICAAMGIDRENWPDLAPLTQLKMGVREDRAGVLEADFQTATQLDKNRKPTGGKKETAISRRYHLANAVFLVGFEGDLTLLKKIQAALKNPAWTLCLGRKAFVPGEPVYLPDEMAIAEQGLSETLKTFPCLVKLKKAKDGEPNQEPFVFRLFLEVEPTQAQGVILQIQDQPLAAFAQRKYGVRYVSTTQVTLSEWEALCI